MIPLSPKSNGRDRERDRRNLARLRATAESRYAQFPTRIAIALLAKGGRIPPIRRLQGGQHDCIFIGLSKSYFVPVMVNHIRRVSCF